jgi:hypothetical protein
MIKGEIKLSVIIVTYNSKDRLYSCLKSIFTNPPSYAYEIIIIDNNSCDGTIEYLHDHISRIDNNIIYISNKRNLGFSKGINQGIKLSKGDLLLLLNPDTVVINNALQLIVDYYKSKSPLSIVGGGMLKPSKEEFHGTYVRKVTFETLLFDFTNLKKLFPNNRYYRQFYFKDKKQGINLKVWGLSGGFLLIPKSVIIQVGLLDERFFMYLEDIDYCRRVRMLDINCYYYPMARVIHYSGSSSHNKFKIDIKAWRLSRLVLAKKYFSIFKYYVIQISFIIDSIISDSINKIKTLFI